MFRRILKILRRPQKMVRTLLLLWKYLAFRVQYGFLRKGRTSPDPERRVLVVSLAHDPAYAKWEGMLLTALRLQGCTPVVLTELSCHFSVLTFRIFGVKDFVYLDDLLAATERGVDVGGVQSFFAEGVTFKKFLDFSYRGVSCGGASLSSLVRKLRTTGLSFSDPHVQELLKTALIRSVKAVHAAEKLFDDSKYEAVLFHERGYTPFGEIYHAAVNRGLNVIQYTYGQKPKSFVLKRYNVTNRKIHPLSLSPKSWSALKALPWGREQEETLMHELRESYASGTWFNRKALLQGKFMKSPEEVRLELGIEEGRKVAVIFSHVLWDATFFFGESLFDDYEHWLIETVNAACQNDAVQWYVKLHPDYVWKMKDLGGGVQPRDVLALQSNIGELPSHVRVIAPETDISTFSIFPVIDYCITVRGTVGLEAPCFGVPVFTAGTGRYSGMGFTIDSSSQEEYLQRMRTIQEYPRLTQQQTSLARRHAWGVFEKRLFFFHSFDLTRRLRGVALETCVDICVKNVSELEQAQDLRAFADFVLHSREEDYLEP